jgi:hypothetical protein
MSGFRAEWQGGTQASGQRDHDEQQSTVHGGSKVAKRRGIRTLHLD